MKIKNDYWAISKGVVLKALANIDGDEKVVVNLPNFTGCKRKFEIEIGHDYDNPDYQGYTGDTSGEYFIDRESGKVLTEDDGRYDHLLDGTVNVDGRVIGWFIDDQGDSSANDDVFIKDIDSDLNDQYWFINCDENLSRVEETILCELAMLRFELYTSQFHNGFLVIFETLTFSASVDRHSYKYYEVDDDILSSVYNWMTAEKLNNGELTCVFVAVDYVVNGEVVGHDAIHGFVGDFFYCDDDSNYLAEGTYALMEECYVSSDMTDEEMELYKIAYTITYSTVDEESVKEGDYADHGWVSEAFGLRFSCANDEREENMREAQQGGFLRTGDVWEMQRDVENLGIESDGANFNSFNGILGKDETVENFGLHLENDCLDMLTVDKILNSLGLTA